jgi:hypothetical protein
MSLNALALARHSTRIDVSAMRSPTLVFAASVVVLCTAALGATRAAETISTTVVATAQVSSRTSLTVSTDLLHFEVTTPGQPATVTVDFVAGARTPGRSQVVLTIEPMRAIGGPGGAADIDTAVSFAGTGDGTLTKGFLRPAGAAVAARWAGSGRRSGQVVFSLRSSASGTYTLPVRFVLSAP